MKDLKKLTLLHSNDMHGDFLAEKVDDKLVGGVGLLCGYLRKVRAEEENVLYAIAGDMFRGSIIDSEYHGLSTIEITNLLEPDVVTIGNHEADYGLAHLLFLEKCARFPIINANLYIKDNGRRLFKPYEIIKIGGMNILFIGIITEEILRQTKSEQMIGTLINTADAAREIEKICNAYKNVDIDLTVVLTHIGYEEDIKLAQLLKPECGVDIIIGGHSHTFLEKAKEENGIVIVQAGTGTDQIGRFDIVVNKDTNSIESYTWQPIPIDSEHCENDGELLELLKEYKNKTDQKYGRVLTHFDRPLTHPRRAQETEIGNLFADIFQESLGVDVMFLGSGSIRLPSLGIAVTVKALKEIFPFDDAIHLIKAKGKTVKKMIKHILHNACTLSEFEFYQVNKAFRIIFNQAQDDFELLTYEGKELEEEKVYTVAIQHYHFENLKDFFGITPQEAAAINPPRIISTSALDILFEYMENHPRLSAKVEGRIVIK